MLESKVSSSLDQSVVSKSSQSVGWRRDLLLQFSLLALAVCLTWRLIGAELPTEIANSIQLALIWLSFFAAVSLWVVGTPWTVAVKFSMIAGSAVLALLIAWSFFRDYKQSVQILEKPREESNRIIHEAIELSYSRLSTSNCDLNPRIVSTSKPATPKTQERQRLAYGETAFLSRQILSTAESSTAIPPTIIVEVQHDRERSLNRFMRDVQDREQGFARIPNIKIVHHAHAVKLKDLHLIEFQFIETRQKLSSRQVFLQAGRFILHFTFNSEIEADQPLFDDFLKSIRLASRGSTNH